MSGPTFSAFILALAAIALAFAMSVTNGGDLEKAGFWLLAAAVTGFCVWLYAEETRPMHRLSRSYVH